MTTAVTSRGPGIAIPPPLFYLAGLALGWALDTQLPFMIDDDGPGRVQIALAATLLAIGGGLMYWGIGTMAHAHTAIMPNQRARALVTSGPYRFTRNPMYLGLAIAYVGGALLTNTAWPLVLLPAVLVIVRAFVIAREERYLRAEFGPEYDRFCGRVRRWL